MSWKQNDIFFENLREMSEDKSDEYRERLQAEAEDRSIQEENNHLYPHD